MTISSYRYVLFATIGLKFTFNAKLNAEVVHARLS